MTYDAYANAIFLSFFFLYEAYAILFSLIWSVQNEALCESPNHALLDKHIPYKLQDYWGTCPPHCPTIDVCILSFRWIMVTFSKVDFLFFDESKNIL